MILKYFFIVYKDTQRNYNSSYYIIIEILIHMMQWYVTHYSF